MNLKKDFIWLGVSIVGFAILSVSFLLMPVESNVVISKIAGVMFWLGLVIGIVFQVLLARQRKIGITKNRVQRLSNQRMKPGILSLFKNPIAVVFDLLMAIGLVGLISSMILTKGMGYICYVFISITVFSFSMHCIFNGRIYFYISNKEKKKIPVKENIETAKEEQ